MTFLPTDIDFTYDDDPGDTTVKLHQEYHDRLHGGEYQVNTVAASGSAEGLPIAAAHHVTMDQNCGFTFSSPTAGHTFLLYLTGAFTPTFPAAVDWDTATPPTYVSPSLYGFTTFNGGTSWIGSLIASGIG